MRVRSPLPRGYPRIFIYFYFLATNGLKFGGWVCSPSENVFHKVEALPQIKFCCMGCPAPPGGSKEFCLTSRGGAIAVMFRFTWIALKFCGWVCSPPENNFPQGWGQTPPPGGPPNFYIFLFSCYNWAEIWWVGLQPFRKCFPLDGGTPTN